MKQFIKTYLIICAMISLAHLIVFRSISWITPVCVLLGCGIGELVCRLLRKKA